MATLLQVGVTDGVPDSGTGEASTLDALMAVVTLKKITYGTPTALTMTLASLASDTNLIAGRQSAVVDNTATLARDYMVGGKVTTGTSPTASRQIEVWAFGSYDGTTFSAGTGAGDANFSPTGEKGLMRLLQIIPTDNTSDHAYEFGPFGIARAFDGIVPHKWGIFIVHNTGQNLNATGGNHEVKYTAIT